MSTEQPTLKIRVAMDPDDGSNWGRDCSTMAKRIVGDRASVLDAKWGREPSKWHETGRGWGRQRLEQSERAYVDACRDLAPDDAAIARLTAIIDRLTA